ncbi:MAG: response regulator transcription factor [Christensenellaceae bacterium]|nr:response regulator transcription factor [Christensenellaceae bacterium]
MLVYYVEDDASIRELVLYTLKHDGFDVKGFEDGTGFHAKCVKKRPDIILLDIMLPGDDGFKILKGLKADEATREIPVILLSAKGMEYDKVKGLDEGADDYLVKPFGVMELLSRIKALIRRTKKDTKKDKQKIKVDDLVMDLKRHTAHLGNEELILTPKEYDLLHFLMLNEGIVCSREMLLDAVWGFSFAGSTRTVDVHIQTLRQKMGESADLIQTVRGIGYRLEVKQ